MWVFRLSRSPQQRQDPTDPLAGGNLPSGRQWFPLLSTSRTAETLCTRWVGFVPVFKMGALSFCLVLDPPPVSKPQNLGVHGEKMLPHSWAALLGLCEESQANQPSSNFRNRAVVAQLYVCCKEHALLCFLWKDRSRFFSENQNNNNKCSK